jgi:type I restriction enzyme S subunit
MGSEWTKVSIESIQANEKGAIAIGPFGSRLKSDNYVESGVPVIRGTNVTGGPTFEGDFVYITEEKADTLGSCNVYKNELVFPHRGSIGEVGIIKEDNRYVLSSSLMKLKVDEEQVDPLFIYYFFKSATGKYELLKNASQVGTPGIGQPLTSLKKIEFNKPSLLQQKKIVNILASLDERIALNRQINQTLEQMAQTLFKSWFVDFDPVIDNALDAGSDIPEVFETRVERRKAVRESADFKPLPDDVRQLFPSDFEESELGWVPKGWEATNLSDFIKFANGKAKKSIEGAVYPLYGANGIIGQSNEAKFNDAIVIGRVGAYCGSIEYCNTSFWASDNTIVAEPKGQITHLPFVLYLLKHLNLNKFAGGAAQPLLNQKVLSSIQVPLSSLDVLESFGSIVSANLEKMFSLNQESTSLEKLRDTLLPKLISGELRLDSAEVE